MQQAARFRTDLLLRGVLLVPVIFGEVRAPKIEKKGFGTSSKAAAALPSIGVRYSHVYLSCKRHSSSSKCLFWENLKISLVYFILHTIFNGSMVGRFRETNSVYNCKVKIKSWNSIQGRGCIPWGMGKVICFHILSTHLFAISLSKKIVKFQVFSWLQHVFMIFTSCRQPKCFQGSMCCFWTSLVLYYKCRQQDWTIIPQN